MGALRARVIVADDSDVFLRAAASVISATSTLRLVGTAGSGQEAIDLVPALRPDLVLLDFRMPGMDGVQTARIIRRDEPRTVVIVISAEAEGLGKSRGQLERLRPSTSATSSRGRSTRCG